MRPSKRLYRAAERGELEPADLDDCEEQETTRSRHSATPLIDGCTGAAAAVIGTFSLAHHFALHPALAWVCVASWCVAARTGVVAGPKCRARVLAAPCGAEVMWLPAALSLLLLAAAALLIALPSPERARLAHALLLEQAGLRPQKSGAGQESPPPPRPPHLGPAAPAPAVSPPAAPELPQPARPPAWRPLERGRQERVRYCAAILRADNGSAGQESTQGVHQRLAAGWRSVSPEAAAGALLRSLTLREKARGTLLPRQGWGSPVRRFRPVRLLAGRPALWRGVGGEEAARRLPRRGGDGRATPRPALAASAHGPPGASLTGPRPTRPSLAQHA